MVKAVAPSKVLRRNEAEAAPVVGRFPGILGFGTTVSPLDGVDGLGGPPVFPFSGVSVCVGVGRITVAVYATNLRSASALSVSAKWIVL